MAEQQLSRRFRRVIVGVIVLVAVVMLAGGAWLVARTIQEVAGPVESIQDLSSGQVATLADGWGHVRALTGWKGWVSTIRQVPSWTGLSPAGSDLDDPLAVFGWPESALGQTKQFALLHTSLEASTEPPVEGAASLVIATAQEPWRALLDRVSAETSTTAFTLPNAALSGRPAQAYLKTVTYSGQHAGSSSILYVFLPDTAAPAVLIIALNRGYALTPAVLHECLSPFQLAPRLP